MIPCLASQAWTFGIPNILAAVAEEPFLHTIELKLQLHALQVPVHVDLPVLVLQAAELENKLPLSKLVGCEVPHRLVESAQSSIIWKRNMSRGSKDAGVKFHTLWTIADL